MLCSAMSKVPMGFRAKAAMKQCCCTYTVKMMAVYAPEQVKTPEEIEIMRYANQVRFASRETMLLFAWILCTIVLCQENIDIVESFHS